MPYIISLFIIGLFFIGCGKNIEDLSITEITKQKKTINIVKSSIISPTLQGTYTLQEGNFSYNGKLDRQSQIVTSSSLIIEKLDSDDYGYYFTMKIGNLKTSNQYNGIFHKQDNKFFKRIIYSPEITKDSNITIDSNMTNPTLQTEIKKDVIDIKHDKNTLTVNMKLGDGRINIIWFKESNSTTPMTKELKEAQHEYIKTYRERFLNYFKED